MQDNTVLIVGAGPTGLTLANLLARLKVPFVLIDKKSGPSPDSKAFAIHARSLEIFHQIGVADEAVSSGNTDNTVHWIVKGKEIVKINITEILPGETMFPFVLVLPQNVTEKLLIDSLSSKGQKVHWNHELLSFTEKGGHINARIKTDEASEILMTFSYIVGCDGAGSSVREDGEFEFKGKSLPDTFYLADCELKWNYTHSDIYFVAAPDYLSIIFSFREKGKYRVFNFLNKAEISEKQVKLSNGDLKNILQSDPYVNIEPENMEWSSVFRIYTRVADKFSKGRVFLVGDAAHVHSPAGGQGMNTGIQDAYNLAWKLAMVLKGQSHPDLLDTYHEERYQIAKNLYNTTDRFFRSFVKRNRFMNFVRMYIFPWLFFRMVKLGWLRDKNLRRISQLSVKYPWSSLNKKGEFLGFEKHTPKPGDRAPFAAIILNGVKTNIYELLNYTRFTILIAAPDELITEFNDLEEFNFFETIPVKVSCINRSSNQDFFKIYGIQDSAIFIIRPDGHIGACTSGTDLKILERYFLKNKF
jgi:2-polyprenyl-6-methoxyphenol hydroxylase-like FAD-dependent oxidoreductase